MHTIPFCRSDLQALVYRAGFPQYNVSTLPHPARNIHSDLTPSKIQMCFYIYVGMSTKMETAYGAHWQSGTVSLHFRDKNVKKKKKNYLSINTNIVELLATGDLPC